MVYAQENLVFLTDGRLLEGEKRLAYWCMPAIFLSLFFLSHSLSIFSRFCYSDSFPLFSLVLACVVLWWWWYCDSLLVVFCCGDVAMHDKDPLYTVCHDWFFTILDFNYFCLDLGVISDHPLVCQLLSHHHLPMLAMPLPITKQRKLFCLLVHRDILIHHSVGILSCYSSWHAPNGSNSSFHLLGGMSS